jgi:hypothetical protein
MPLGCYVLEQRDDTLIVWRISEGEPEAEANAPLPLWPLLLKED